MEVDVIALGLPLVVEVGVGPEIPDILIDERVFLGINPHTVTFGQRSDER